MYKYSKPTISVCLLTCTIFLFTFIIGCNNDSIIDSGSDNSEIKRLSSTEDKTFLEETFQVTNTYSGESAVEDLHPKLLNDYSDKDGIMALSMDPVPEFTCIQEGNVDVIYEDGSSEPLFYSFGMITLVNPTTGVYGCYTTLKIWTESSTSSTEGTQLTYFSTDSSWANDTNSVVYLIDPEDGSPNYNVYVSYDDGAIWDVDPQYADDNISLAGKKKKKKTIWGDSFIDCVYLNTGGGVAVGTVVCVAFGPGVVVCAISSWVTAGLTSILSCGIKKLFGWL
jgi:hypothetical protein